MRYMIKVKDSTECLYMNDGIHTDAEFSNTGSLRATMVVSVVH